MLNGDHRPRSSGTLQHGDGMSPDGDYSLRPHARRTRRIIASSHVRLMEPWHILQSSEQSRQARTQCVSSVICPPAAVFAFIGTGITRLDASLKLRVDPLLPPAEGGKSGRAILLFIECRQRRGRGPSSSRWSLKELMRANVMPFFPRMSVLCRAKLPGRLQAIRDSTGGTREGEKSPGDTACRSPALAHPTRTHRAPSARSRLKAALIRARWVNACGKLPRASPLLPVCSAYRPRWLA